MSIEGKEIKKGILHLIPTPIGENSLFQVIPISVKKEVSSLNNFIVESERSARRFIKKIIPNKNQDELNIFLLNKFTSKIELENYLYPCLNGISMGLVSDAGCPGIADPGALIVSKAHKFGIIVKPHVGPSSIILALMSSGMSGQNFSFNGYLVIEKRQRLKDLKKFEQLAISKNQTQIFIETPYRSDTFVFDALKVLNNNTRFCIACDLSLNSEYIKTLSILEWRKEKPDLNRRPCIFIIERGG